MNRRSLPGNDSIVLDVHDGKGHRALIFSGSGAERQVALTPSVEERLRRYLDGVIDAVEGGVDLRAEQGRRSGRSASSGAGLTSVADPRKQGRRRFGRGKGE